MSTNVINVNGPSMQVARSSRRVMGGNGNLGKLEKHPLRQGNKNSSKSKNNELAISIPRTQVLPNGEKPNFGTSSSSRRAKNSFHKRRGGDKQRRGSLHHVKEKTGILRQRDTKQSSKSDAKFGLIQPSTPVWARSPMVPTSPLERPATKVASSFGASQEVACLVPSFPGASRNFMPYIPQISSSEAQVQAGSLGTLPFYPSYFDGLGHGYGNYAARPIPQLNTQRGTPATGEVCSQAPVPLLRMPQVSAGSEVTAKTIKYATTGASSNRKSLESHDKRSTSFAGASFASKDPVINKLPKPSFA